MTSIENLLRKDPASAFWKLYKQEREAHTAQRYHAMALLCELTPVDEVAEILHVHFDTILNWIELYNEGGIKALSPKKAAGPPPKLTEEEITCLKSDMLTSPRELGYKFSNWDGNAIQHHIEKKFKVTMTRNGVYAMLHRIGMRLVTPRPKPAKADQKKDFNFCRSSIKSS